MKRSVNKAKMHHYVPRSYLARFADSSGFLHIFDRATQTFRRQRPKEVMKINAYYHQKWTPTGIDPNILETTLGEGLEAKAKRAIDRLISEPSQLTDDDTANLLTYIEFQRIRVPRQAVAAKELMRAELLRLVSPEAADAIASDQIKLSIKDSARFEYMRMVIGNLVPWFGQMEWEVFSAERGASFITTDSPVSFFNPNFPPPAEAGIGLIETMVFFPLSSKHALVMRHPENSNDSQTSIPKLLPALTHEDGHLAITHGGVLSRDLVDNFNWKLVQLSSSLVVGESAEVLSRCTDAPMQPNPSAEGRTS